MACIPKRRKKNGGLIGALQRDIKKQRKASPLFDLGYRSAKRARKRKKRERSEKLDELGI